MGWIAELTSWDESLAFEGEQQRGGLGAHRGSEDAEKTYRVNGDSPQSMTADEKTHRRK